MMGKKHKAWDLQTGHSRLYTDSQNRTIPKVFSAASSFTAGARVVISSNTVFWDIWIIGRHLFIYHSLQKPILADLMIYQTNKQSKKWIIY